MNTYHVTFFYHASGMEQGADQRDFGIYYAMSKDGAERQALAQHFPNERENWGFIQGCLTAKEVK